MIAMHFYDRMCIEVDLCKACLTVNGFYNSKLYDVDKFGQSMSTVVYTETDYRMIDEVRKHDHVNDWISIRKEIAAVIKQV